MPDSIVKCHALVPHQQAHQVRTAREIRLALICNFMMLFSCRQAESAMTALHGSSLVPRRQGQWRYRWLVQPRRLRPLAEQGAAGAALHLFGSIASQFPYYFSRIMLE